LETENNNQQIIEALLFASDKPLSKERIQAVISAKGGFTSGGKDITSEQIEEAINSLNERYRAGGHSFAVKKIARGYQMYTLPDFAPWIKALFSHTRRERLSHQALEVLSIIAYKQPIVKSEIDRFRGVNSEGPLFTLLDRKLITIVGRKPAPGRPLLYGTTQEFLTHFGLNDLDDLPRMEELEMILKRKEASFATNPTDEKSLSRTDPPMAEKFEKTEVESSAKVEKEKTEEEELEFSPREVNLSMKEEITEAEIPIAAPPEPPSQVSPEDEAE
jgi:segregation and condensation protein B